MMLPMPVGEGARPYFPYAFPVFNGEGMALGMEMFKSEEIESALPQAFMNLVETVQAFPQTLQVGSEQVWEHEPHGLGARPDGGSPARGLGGPTRGPPTLHGAEIWLLRGCIASTTRFHRILRMGSAPR